MKIKGLEEYGSARDAYDRLREILDEAEKLRAYIKEHKEGASFVRAEEGEEFDKVQERTGLILAENTSLEERLQADGKYAKSRKILFEIEKKIGTDNGLYWQETELKYVSIAGNAATAIAYAKIGETGKAKEILNNIEEKSIKSNGLYFEFGRVGTMENAMMAYLYLALGNNEKAKVIMDALNGEISIKNGLYTSGKNSDHISITSNAIIASTLRGLGQKNEARGILDQIEKNQIYKAKGDIYLDYKKGEISTTTNAAIAVAWYENHFYIKGPRVIANIERIMPKQGELFCEGVEYLKIYTGANALMAIAYALQEDRMPSCGG